jgi:YtkA-like protein
MFAHTGELPISGRQERPSWHAPSLSTSLLAVLLTASTLSFERAWRVASIARAESSASASVRPGVVTSFGYRASHNGRYHAEVVSVPPLSVGESQRWTIRLTRRNHRRLAAAHVTTNVWMPETGARSLVRPRVSYLGGGRYAIDGVALSRPGWWNVALVIQGRAGTDSVAFNAVLP